MTRFPPDRTMRSLSALADDLGGEYRDDRPELVIRHADGHWLVFAGEIDELEKRGWITLGDPDGDAATLNVTEAGRHWLRRWEKAEAKRR